MPFTLILLLVVFILALIWLLTWEPREDDGKKKDKSKTNKDEKPLREEIEGVFKDLKSNAIIYKRDECVPSLENAYSKVIEVLEKRELVKS